MPEAKDDLPLSPYFVLDLTRARAGPTAARQLADWGANVVKVEELTKQVLVENDTAKRDQLIKTAYDITQTQDWAYVPLHQQALAWGVSKKVKVVQRADNQILFYWFRKE